MTGVVAFMQVQTEREFHFEELNKSAHFKVILVLNFFPLIKARKKKFEIFTKNIYRRTEVLRSTNAPLYEQQSIAVMCVKCFHLNV